MHCSNGVRPAGMELFLSDSEISHPLGTYASEHASLTGRRLVTAGPLHPGCFLSLGIRIGRDVQLSSWLVKPGDQNRIVD